MAKLKRLKCDGHSNLLYNTGKITLMNRINPVKLLNSKWTSIHPVDKEKHFIVTALIRDDLENIEACTMEAVISNHSYEVKWQSLKDNSIWQMGWK